MKHLFDIWLHEFRTILHDEGLVLFLLVLPFVYPVLYSWIYNNEVVREVPIAVVDDSHSALSREFIERMDASPDVTVALHCRDMIEAERSIGHGETYGILYFPKDFGKDIGRMEQAHASVYCDMSYMLTYKAIFQTATAVSGVMGAEIQTKLLGNTTKREDEISTKPLAFDEVPIFNVTGGYGNFIIPGVLVLIIQQAMLLGVGMITGTRREEQKRSKVAIPEELIGIRAMLGRAMCYFLIFAIMLAWITLIVPRIFGFVSLVHAKDLGLFMFPYLLACTFFSMCIAQMMRYRESVMLVVVFTSLPLLFMSGVSWPLNSIPAFWQGVSWLFPSTFAIRGFIRMSSMGALLCDVQQEYIALYVLTAVYFLIACLIYRRR